MVPELITGAVVAVITAGPAYIALRRERGSAQAEGEATRAAVNQAVGHAVEVLTLRVDEMHRDVRRLEDWQTSHTAEHIIQAENRRPPS